MESTTKQLGSSPQGKGKPTNLYLKADLVAAGRKHAQEKYGCSLSVLVERLLIKEARANARRKK